MRIAIVRNLRKPEIEPFLADVRARLEREGHETRDLAALSEATDARAALEGTDLVLVLGGDGTTLKAASLVAGLLSRGLPAPPLVAVDFGRRGFLSSCDPDTAFETIERAARGEAHLVLRRLGRVRFESSGAEHLFLNETSLLRLPESPPLTIEVSMPGRVVRTRADGLVVATETGSSAYARSVGGPLVCGLAGALVVAFIAPVTHVPPFVVDGERCPVRVDVLAGEGRAARDGTPVAGPATGRIVVSASEFAVRFLVDEQHYVAKMQLEGDAAGDS